MARTGRIRAGALSAAWLILLTGLLAGCATGGSGPTSAHEARFQAGNDAYERGDYLEAAAAYRELLGEGIATAPLHYNLGNSLFKSGRLGEAILEYERAHRLSPQDSDIQENLEYLRTLTVDRITPEASPLKALGLSYLLDLTTPGQDAALFLACWIGAGTAFSILILARSEGIRRAALYAAGLLLVPALIGGASLAVKGWIDSTRTHAVVLESQVNVLSGAGEGNPALFTVHEGLRVRLRARNEGWLQVSLENGLSGWIPAGVVEEI